MSIFFAETLRQLRMERALSQQDLAVRMNGSRSTVARWENGSRLPDVAMLPMTITLCIHMIAPVFQVFGIGMAVCVLTMFVIILSNQVEQCMLQQREIAHQRSRIMVLQMRPHFIYNTMTSIYYLCGQDPQRPSRSPWISPPTCARTPPPLQVNTREPLATMCGGRISIVPRNGGGTVVRVTIPYQQ